MTIDLHTLRKASDEAARAWSLRQRSWCIVGIDKERHDDSRHAVKALLDAGREVHFVCPACAEAHRGLLGRPVHPSIRSIDATIEVLSLHGDLDEWSLLPEVGQRMEWYGDLKAIWTGDLDVSDAWRSEVHDYGLAVAAGEPLVEALSTLEVGKGD